MKIRTEYDPKPIPLRSCDWLAVDDETYDGPGAPIGSGATEQDAIDDLLAQLSPEELEQIEAEEQRLVALEEQRAGEEMRFQAYRDRDIDDAPEPMHVWSND